MEPSITPLRIVFMGTPDFAVPSLEALLTAGANVVAAVTGPDKPRGRGQSVVPTPVKTAAERHNLPVLQPEDLKAPEFAAQLRALDPDLAVVVAFRILPPSVYTIPSRGSFNLHASLLPRYRGAAPINWAIISGDTETGVTTFFLDEKVDTGSMILQERVPILPDDDAGSMHDKLAVLGARTVVETVRLISGGEVSLRSQDPELVSKAPKIFKDDCRIHWDQPAEQVRNFIRGMSPVPGAWTMNGEKLLKVFRTVRASERAGEPGAVRVDGQRLYVQCSDASLEILELQQEGRKRMHAEEFLRGTSLATSIVLR
jgi:methionyl-tRNA formyltransferase